MKIAVTAAVVLLCSTTVLGKLDPAKTPPLGWRSWNALLLNVDQDGMLAQAKAAAAKPSAGGKSLAELGFSQIGVDDGWQACGDGVDGSFHDSNGKPLVNTTRFPDLKAMVAAGKSMGVSFGWYQNNCFCSGQERKAWSGTPPNGGNPKQDVQLVIDAGFTGVKVDGCGPAHNITVWSEFIAAADNDILLENCGDNHDSWTPPDPSAVADHCDYNMYRISTDIAPQFLSTMYNLNQQTRYVDVVRPGCWPYPDMLQVGNWVEGSGYSGGLDAVESRTHFAGWCITSAPLILGFDLTNSTAYDLSYPIVSNPDALRVNQAWNGDPGRIVFNSTTTFTAEARHGASGTGKSTQTFFTYQVWKKTLNNGETAGLIVNLSSSSLNVKVDLSVFGLSGTVTAKDVWSGKSSSVSSLQATLAPHDSMFVIMS